MKAAGNGWQLSKLWGQTLVSESWIDCAGSHGLLDLSVPNPCLLWKDRTGTSWWAAPGVVMQHLVSVSVIIISI